MYSGKQPFHKRKQDREALGPFRLLFRTRERGCGRDPHKGGRGYPPPGLGGAKKVKLDR